MAGKGKANGVGSISWTEQETKFSLAVYSADSHRNKERYGSGVLVAESDRPEASQAKGSIEPIPNEFDRCVEEIRNVLVASKGKTDEEKQQYSEALNRAVLGFEQERGQFLAIISDQLAKKRLSHIEPPNRTFGSLAEAVFAEVIGLNMLELVMKNREGLEEIQVVGRDIYEVRNGQAAPSAFRFQSVRDVER
ncbi:MAG: Flp pilus assembly protein ATPase CpaF [Paenibacillus sp.]|nr:Flp pilus assembly protein ATPase CpaF [Paenibacillus sp.]